MKTKKSFHRSLLVTITWIRPVSMMVVVIMIALMPSCASKKKIVPEATESAAPQPPPPPPPAPAPSEPYVVVEEMPMFPGGDSALIAHIVKSVRYPESARAAGIQGRVISRFSVNVDGSVGRISVLKGVHPELDAEAIRVVSNLPAFKPGKQGGVSVPVWYMVPIEFKLN
jgi:periplasmic protein TonB